MPGVSTVSIKTTVLAVSMVTRVSAQSHIASRNPPTSPRPPPASLVQTKPFHSVAHGAEGDTEELGRGGAVVSGFLQRLEDGFLLHAVEIVLPKYACMRYDQIHEISVVWQDLWVPWYDSAVHCTVNVVILRFWLYCISALALWFMVARAALGAFT